jgi:serine protease Do
MEVHVNARRGARRWMRVAGMVVAGLAVWASGRWGGDVLAGSRTAAVDVAPSVLNLQDSFAAVAARAKPAVVSITAVHVESIQPQPYEFYFGDPFEDFFREFQGLPGRPRSRGTPPPIQRKSQGVGSGVIVDERGYVLTNEHVVRGADELTVTVPGDTPQKYAGKVVGADPRTDLAVIKITGPKPFDFIPLGDSEKVRVGDWAIAVGSPFGLAQTVTVGVISALRQSLQIEGVNYTGLLQTDAAINRGNSGGPLINIRGEVIGINSAIYAPTGVFAGIGFAIPVNRVKDIMGQLIEKGRVVRGWMGVEVRPVDEVIARQFGLEKPEGALLENVLPRTPAEKAGLKRGDVIVSVDGEKILDREALVERVSRTRPKTTLRLGVIRDQKKLELNLTTAEMPSEKEAASGDAPDADASPSKPVAWEGARLADLSPDLARRYGLPLENAGAVVLTVAPGGLAERLGLAEGDLIASVNRQRTAGAAGFVAAVKKADPKEGLLLDVFRGGRWLYLSFRAAP